MSIKVRKYLLTKMWSKIVGIEAAEKEVENKNYDMAMYYGNHFGYNPHKHNHVEDEDGSCWD